MASQGNSYLEIWSQRPDSKWRLNRTEGWAYAPLAKQSLIEKPYTLQILHRLYNTSPLRFTELQNLLRVSPKVLTSRLQELGELGVVVRRSHDEIPPCVDYELSPKGKDLV